MKIEKLHVKNFKSLVDVEIIKPNPFTVFVGPNGSGKSNIFEAIEFSNYYYKFGQEALNIFGGSKEIFNINEPYDHIDYTICHDTFDSSFIIFQIESSFKVSSFGTTYFSINKDEIIQLKKYLTDKNKTYLGELEQFQDKFSRLFIGNESLRKQNTFSDSSLNIDASNLENVLKRILAVENVKEDIIEWLQIFIPEFEKIEIQTSSLSGKNELAIYEKALQQPLTKNLISDGTYNILALLTAVFQTDEPQFLCIEEPENGLNPFVIKKLVGLFREACETKGHYIWLNTHSQTLVNQLKPEELILVNKMDGATTIKQLAATNLHGLDLDEAWLTNALGGGVPW